MSKHRYPIKGSDMRLSVTHGYIWVGNDKRTVGYIGNQRTLRAIAARLLLMNPPKLKERQR